MECYGLFEVMQIMQDLITDVEEVLQNNHDIPDYGEEWLWQLVRWTGRIWPRLLQFGRVLSPDPSST
jgi:hypothetical protein